MPKVYYVSANFSDCEGYWETFLGVFDTLEEAQKVKSEYDELVTNIKSEENPVPYEIENTPCTEWGYELFDEWCKWNDKQSKLYDFNEVEIRTLNINEKQPFELDEEM